MLAYLRLCNVVHWLSLIIWISALVSAAIAAMNVFGTLDEMPLVLEAYPHYPGSEHARLAAGHIMSGVFFTADLLQFIAIPLTVLTLLAQLLIFRLPLKRPANLLRTACIMIAAAGFACHAMVLAPRMNEQLRQFWSEAEAGEAEAAAAHRAAFNRDHPTAQNIMQLNLLLLVTAACCSAVALGPSQLPRSTIRAGEPRVP